MLSLSTAFEGTGPSLLTPKLIFNINFWCPICEYPSKCHCMNYEHAGDKNKASRIVDLKVCENGWLVFILHDAWGPRWRAFSLSESVWITPLCASTHDRRLGRRREWQTQKERGGGVKISLSCAFVSLFLYLSSFSILRLHGLNTKRIYFVYFSIEQVYPWINTWVSES